MKYLLSLTLCLLATISSASDLVVVGNVATVTGTAGDDAIACYLEGGNTVFEDANGITASPGVGIIQVSPTRVEVDNFLRLITAGTDFIDDWQINLGDGADTFDHDIGNGDPLANGVISADGGDGADEYVLSYFGFPVLVFMGSGSLDIGTALINWTNF